MSRHAGNAARKTETLTFSSRYQISRCIAKGGMGAVYVGVQRGAGGFARPVAIKRMHAHLLEDAGARKLILEEARLASSVRHPNVVRSGERSARRELGQARPPSRRRRRDPQTQSRPRLALRGLLVR